MGMSGNIRVNSMPADHDMQAANRNTDDTCKF